MSAAALATCWGDLPMPSSGVSAASYRLVAVAIADIVNDAHDNQFFGSIKNLADKVRLNRDTVRRCVGAMVESGVLEVVRTRDGDTSIYRWVWFPPRGETATHPAATPRPPRGDAAPNSNELQDELNRDSTRLPADAVAVIDLNDVDASFAEFWRQYPRHEGRPQARAAWGRLSRDNRDRALLTVGAWAEAARTGAWEFVCYAQRWLNEERWNAAIPRPRPNLAPATSALLRVAQADPRLRRSS